MFLFLPDRTILCYDVVPLTLLLVDFHLIRGEREENQRGEEGERSFGSMIPTHLEMKENLPKKVHESLLQLCKTKFAGPVMRCRGLSLAMRHLISESWFELRYFASDSAPLMHSGRQQRMIHVIALSFTWRTTMTLLAPDLSLAQLWLLGAFGM